MNADIHMKEQMDEDGYASWLSHRKMSGEEAVVQLRINAGGVLHVQVYHPETVFNRPYGFAEKYVVPSHVIDWLATHEGEYQSFASGEKVYIRPKVRLTSYEDGVQISIGDTDGEVNKAGATGFILDVDSSKEKNGQLIDALTMSGLCDDAEGSRWMPEVSE